MTLDFDGQTQQEEFGLPNGEPSISADAAHTDPKRPAGKRKALTGRKKAPRSKGGRFLPATMSAHSEAKLSPSEAALPVNGKSDAAYQHSSTSAGQSQGLGWGKGLEQALPKLDEVSSPPPETPGMTHEEDAMTALEQGIQGAAADSGIHMEPRIEALPLDATAETGGSAEQSNHDRISEPCGELDSPRGQISAPSGYSTPHAGSVLHDEGQACEEPVNAQASRCRNQGSMAG